jgi:hypothetical protein
VTLRQVSAQIWRWVRRAVAFAISILQVLFTHAGVLCALFFQWILSPFIARVRRASAQLMAWFRGWERSDILSALALLLSALALLGSAAAFALNVLVRVDDLKLMVPTWPTMSGGRQKVTITSPQFMAFLNMGNRPIAVTRIGFVVEGTDAAGKQVKGVKEVQIEPFIVDGGKILMKELSSADGSVTFNPAEIFKISDKNETMNLKLLAAFLLVTPDGSIQTNIDLHSELQLPPSGARAEVKIVISPAEGAARVTAPATLYHHRSLTVPW